ncbi:MAG: FecR domain-containing protein [Deltaproteobacteria bacterium]|nr:FecR domain-containing protein [Deltaproteobacteria bacterium]
MKKHLFLQNNKTSIDATNWLAELKSDSMSPETEQLFRWWLSKNQKNQVEFHFIEAIWDFSVTMKDHPLVVQDIVLKNSRGRREQRQNWLSRFRFSVPKLVATAVVLFVITGFWITQRPAGIDKAYQTFTGEQKTVILADGSTVHLDAETEMTVQFSNETRHLELKTGRALFSVNHDPARPFVVAAGNVVVRALGTVFNVYKKRTGRVKVSVSEGSVNVSKADLSPISDADEATRTLPGSASPLKQDANTRKPEQRVSAANIVVKSGQEIVVEQKRPRHKPGIDIRDVDIKEVQAWREGKLCFRDASLPEVIEEINRYLDDKIVIGDQRLKNLEISMVFKLSDRKHFLNALEETVPITHKTVAGKLKIFLQKEEV